MLEVFDVDVIWSCRVVVSCVVYCVFRVFCCDFYLSCGEASGFLVCNAVVCVCLVLDYVRELFVECLCFLFVRDGRVCVECDGSVCCLSWFFVV